MTGTPRGAGSQALDLSRTRLVVIQVLVIALMATLLGRLWYLQVATGDAYQAQAADNAVRDVIVQPQRGLIVDAMGRPLAASRQSWVVSVDRTLLGRLRERQRDRLLRTVAGMVDQPVRTIKDRLLLCGAEGAPPPPRCWNGSPYQPVPIAKDVDQRVAVDIQERREDFPAVLAEQQPLRDYPQPFGINAAHLLGYLSPATAGEYERARSDGDRTVTAQSQVGRAGVEKEYDRWLRGVPGADGMAVDSQGRVLGADESRRPRAGDTLVTSIDARVQAVVERELKATIMGARNTVDKVTGRRYEAPAGAAIVMDPDDGSVVAMASYPTYDPEVWVGGISDAQLEQLYSKRADEPLLSRPTQAQLAPGSTFKPFMAMGALSTDRFSPATRLNCSSSFTVGNRAYKNFESGSYGLIGFDRAMQVSCNTFFYRVGYDFWVNAGGDSATATTKDPLVEAAKSAGFGSPTGVDLPSEATGRIADRRWKMQYWKQNKDYYCELGKEPGTDFLHRYAREFCIDGYDFRAGDAVNFVIGQGDTIITPIQLATGYAAIANGGTLWEPRVGKALLSPSGKVVRRLKPKVQAKLPFPDPVVDYVDNALQGTPKDGTLAWKYGDFPLDKVAIRGKTGTAEVYGKQTTSWLANYTKDYVIVMMVEQGGTGSGTSGDSMRRIWEALYGIKGQQVRPADALIPGTTPPARLPSVDARGLIDPPEIAGTRARASTAGRAPRSGRARASGTGG
ncbi:penicillin-binding protein 2 [soil metagenome]